MIKNHGELTFKFVSIVIILVFFVATLSGCRKSPALVDTVYTQDAAEVDPNYIAVESTEDAVEENESHTREEDTSDRQSGEEQQIAAVQSESSEETDPSREMEKSLQQDQPETSGGGTGQRNDNVPNSSGGNSSDDFNGDSDGSGSGGNNQESSSDSNNDSSSSSDSNPGDSPSMPDDNMNQPRNPDDTSGNNSETGDTDLQGNSGEDDSDLPKPKRRVTDTSGTEQDIPEDVFTVTAVGDAAPIVEMIGGSGRLIASSESFTSSESLGYVLCSDVKSGQVQTWWSGDGSETIDSEHFQILLDTKPDVCFEISGQMTFSSEQITQLAEHDIGYLTLPELTSVDGMKSAVTIVANAMEVNSDSGMDAQRIAQNYVDWIDSTISEVSNKRKDYDFYSFYVTDWRDDISYDRFFQPDENGYVVDFPGIENGHGNGVAIGWTQEKNVPFLDFMMYVGATDTMMDLNHQPKSDLGLVERYIFPYEKRFGYPVYSNNSIYYFHFWEYQALPDQYSFTDGFHAVCTYGSMYYNTDEHIALGDERFPCVIVSNDYVRSRIESSAQWKAGFLDSPGAYDIEGDYAVYVNPVGFDNWAEGSVDSPLEMYWLACRVCGTINENEMRSKVQKFYSDFYGRTLSDAQIDNIVNR